VPNPGSNANRSLFRRDLPCIFAVSGTAWLSAQGKGTVRVVLGAFQYAALRARVVVSWGQLLPWPTAASVSGRRLTQQFTRGTEFPEPRVRPFRTPGLP
jgi:hypothetical protein